MSSLYTGQSSYFLLYELRISRFSSLVKVSPSGKLFLNLKAVIAFSTLVMRFMHNPKDISKLAGVRLAVARGLEICNPDIVDDGNSLRYTSSINLEEWLKVQDLIKLDNQSNMIRDASNDA